MQSSVCAGTRVKERIQFVLSDVLVSRDAFDARPGSEQHGLKERIQFVLSDVLVSRGAFDAHPGSEQHGPKASTLYKLVYVSLPEYGSGSSSCSVLC